MRAVVYHGPGSKQWDEVPKPTIVDDGDAIVRVDAVTICGTDLHIPKGDVPAVTDGRHIRGATIGPSDQVRSALLPARANCDSESGDDPRKGDPDGGCQS